MHSALRTRLGLESLDSRLVPSASVLDLTTAGSEATAPSGAIVQQTDPQPTGTGFIHSFVRIQGAASGGGTEQGYNTDGRPLQFDENKSPQFTRSLALSDVPIVFVDGVAYRQFLLDINQKASSPLLSLDEVRVFLGSTGNLTGYDTTANTLAGQAAVFDLDSGGDVSVLLNARLSHGSGSGDMFLLIPNSAFVGADPSSFVYLYSKFGGLPGASANSGFEEWAVKSTPSQSPVGNSTLSGFVYVDPDQIPGDGDEAPIPGVPIELDGVNDLGQTVVLTTTTDANGAFSFTGLRAGTYTIIETQPQAFLDGADYVGSLGGIEAVNDQFSTIQLGTNQNGVNYIFTETRTE